MTSYTCKKCGQTYSLDEVHGGICPFCGEASVSESKTEAVTDPARQAAVYAQAKAAMERAGAYGEFETAGKLFRMIGDYEDAPLLAARCEARAEEIQKEDTYQQALKMQGHTPQGLQGKILLLESIAGYRNATQLADAYRSEREALLAKEAAEKQEQEAKSHAENQVAHQKNKSRRRVVVACVIAGAVILLGVLAFSLFILPANQYKKAVAQYDAGNYLAASEQFGKISTYKDSNTYLAQSYYHLGQEAVAKDDLFAAEDYFDRADDLGGCPEAAAELANVRGVLYELGLTQLDSGEYTEAQATFDALGNYEDSKAYKQFCRAIRYWNGEQNADTEKADIGKAEKVLWKMLDGVWYGETSEKELTINAETRDTTAPDLTVADNKLIYTADGVDYEVQMLSKVSMVLVGDGAFAGRYDKV